MNDGTHHGDPPYLLEEGWMPLLNGRDLGGWRPQDPQKGEGSTTRAVFWDSLHHPRELLALTSSGDRLVNGRKGGISNIVSTRRFGDVELYLEFLLPARSNSGVYLHGLYEVQVLDSFGIERPTASHCGGIYPHWIDGKQFGGTPPLVNASRRPGEWQCQIWFQAPRFDTNGMKTGNARFVRVLHNGLLIHDNVEVDGPTREALDIPEAPANPLMLQGDHGPVAYRNIYIRPLRPLVRR